MATQPPNVADNQEARNLAIKDQIYVTGIDGHDRSVYVTHTPLVRLVAPSLFQSMLADTGARFSEPHDSTATMSAGLRPSEEHHESFESLGGANRFLCVGLDEQKSAWSSGWVGEGPDKRAQIWRPFIEEGFERLPDVWFMIESSGNRRQRQRVLATQATSELHATWVELLSTLDSSELAKLSTRVYVPRTAIMKFVLDVMREVGAMHAHGKLHGDLKPSNVLVSRNGSTLIDEVGIEFGDVSPTVTVGWSPPEQLLREPLTHAADIYPLGEMIRLVLQAESLGKMVNFTLPGDTSAKVCENPTIYMRPDSEVLPIDRRSGWYDLIERALATRPSERWESVEAMAHALEQVIANAPVAEFVEVTFPWGQQPKLARTEQGDVQMAWVLVAPEDSRWAFEQW